MPIFFSAYIIFTTMQAKYNVTVRYIFATIVAVEAQRVLHLPKSMFETLIIQDAMHILRPVSCDLSGSTIFFHVISSIVRFFKTKVT